MVVKYKMKNVLITGGGNGIGCAIAKKFIQNKNFKVFIVDKSFEELKKLPLYSNFYTFQFDIKDEKSVKEFILSINEGYGGIDILINNVGISPKKINVANTIENIELVEWNKVIAVNLTSTFLFIKYIIPSMKEKRWGRIITMSSQSARTAAKIASPHYVATKSALIGISRQIASQYGKYNITSNCIAPGRIESNMTKAVSDQVNQEFLNQIPISRMGKKEEVAALVEFLSREEASYITGTTIDINGGAFIG